MAFYPNLPDELKYNVFKYANLPVKTIESLCAKNYAIYEMLCSYKPFWVELARKRISSTIDFQGMTISNLMRSARTAEDFLNKFKSAKYPARYTADLIKLIDGNHDLVVMSAVDAANKLLSPDERDIIIFQLLYYAIQTGNIGLVRKIYPIVRPLLRLDPERAFSEMLGTATDINVLTYLIDNRPHNLTDDEHIVIIVNAALADNRPLIQKYIASIANADDEVKVRFMQSIRELPADIREYILSLLPPMEEFDIDLEFAPNHVGGNVEEVIDDDDQPDDEGEEAEDINVDE